MRTQIILVLVTCVLLAASMLDPLFPEDQWLQHVPTVPLLLIILYGVRRCWWSTPAVICMVVFALLHILGARFVYSCVPYDHWLQQCFGWSINQAMGWQRNHYDRLVHFLFGILMVLPLAELFARRNCICPAEVVFVAVSVTAAASGLYEVLEWLASVVMSPEQGTTFNGQQGDFWDAQKDMALAFAGSVIAAAVVWRRIKTCATSSR